MDLMILVIYIAGIVTFAAVVWLHSKVNIIKQELRDLSHYLKSNRGDDGKDNH